MEKIGGRSSKIKIETRRKRINKKKKKRKELKEKVVESRKGEE